MKNPQVILVGGAPGAGKTTLGRSLARHMGSASLTVDDLLVAVRSVTTPDSHPAFHPSGGAGHVEYFTSSTPEELIAGSIALGDAVWPVVERVVRMRLLKQEKIVIDWWLLPIEAVAALETETDSLVASVWLHINDEALWARERKHYEFVAPSSDPDRMLANFMARSLWRNNAIAAGADAIGLRVIEQPGDTPVERLVERAIDLLGVTI